MARREKDIRAVRDVVFVNEQGIPPGLEWDGSDSEYIHVLAGGNGEGNAARSVDTPGD